MDKFFLKDFFRGWIVGNFEPTLLKTKDIEIALQSYNAGDEEPQHYHKVGTEISLLVSGSATFNNEVINAGLASRIKGIVKKNQYKLMLLAIDLKNKFFYQLIQTIY